MIHGECLLLWLLIHFELKSSYIFHFGYWFEHYEEKTMALEFDWAKSGQVRTSLLCHWKYRLYKKNKNSESTNCFIFWDCFSVLTKEREEDGDEERGGNHIQSQEQEDEEILRRKLEETKHVEETWNKLKEDLEDVSSVIQDFAQQVKVGVSSVSPTVSPNFPANSKSMF